MSNNLQHKKSRPYARDYYKKSINFRPYFLIETVFPLPE